MEGLIFDLLTEIVKLTAIVLAGFTITATKNWLKSRFEEQEIKTIYAIVEDGVLFAQQVYGHLDGPERYNEAIKRIESILNERGIEVSKDQLDTMIEATVKALKSEYGDLW